MPPYFVTSNRKLRNIPLEPVKPAARLTVIPVWIGNDGVVGFFVRVFPFVLGGLVPLDTSGLVPGIVL